MGWETVERGEGGRWGKGTTIEKKDGTVAHKVTPEATAKIKQGKANKMTALAAKAAKMIGKNVASSNAAREKTQAKVGAYLGGIKNKNDAMKLAKEARAAGHEDAAKLLERNWQSVASRPALVDKIRASIAGGAKLPFQQPGTTLMEKEMARDRAEAMQKPGALTKQMATRIGEREHARAYAGKPTVASQKAHPLARAEKIAAYLKQRTERTERPAASAFKKMMEQYKSQLSPKERAAYEAKMNAPVAHPGGQGAPTGVPPASGPKSNLPNKAMPTASQLSVTARAAAETPVIQKELGKQFAAKGAANPKERAAKLAAWLSGRGEKVKAKDEADAKAMFGGGTPPGGPKGTGAFSPNKNERLAVKMRMAMRSIRKIQSEAHNWPKEEAIPRIQLARSDSKRPPITREKAEKIRAYLSKRTQRELDKVGKAFNY